MTRTSHNILNGLYFLIVVSTILILSWFGKSYYELPVSERFFHPMYDWLKPSGLLGHALGICGAFLIVSGLIIYSVRKRVRFFARWGRLKYWLNFHIFLCTWGTVLVLFHTTFKFGGVIAIGFWSLLIVWVSGVIGRFIYIQIPRTIEGREYTLNELHDQKKILTDQLWLDYKLNFSEIRNTLFSKIRLKLISNQISTSEYGKIKKLIRNQKMLEYRINNLVRLQKLFHNWHIAHIPFAIIMVIILIIHIAVVLFFGYKWIF